MRGCEERTHYGTGARDRLAFGRDGREIDCQDDVSSSGIINLGILSCAPVHNPDYAPVHNQLRRQTLVLRDPNLHGGFAQLPTVVLRDHRLSASAVRLYALLLSYAWSHQQCFPGQQRLARDMGCNISTITRTLAELNEHCLVSWTRQGLGKTNIYCIERLSDGYLRPEGDDADGD